MEQTKALIITDVIKEPRTFEITSNQIQQLLPEQQFEIDLQDMEGYGSFYGILSHSTAPEKGIQYALANGAEWVDVWVEKGIPGINIFHLGGNRKNPSNNFEEWISDVLNDFFKTCERFYLVGNYKGTSYMETHKYDTYNAVFSLKEDYETFKILIDIINSTVSIEEKKLKGIEILKNRPITNVPDCVQWEHL